MKHSDHHSAWSVIKPLIDDCLVYPSGSRYIYHPAVSSEESDYDVCVPLQHWPDRVRRISALLSNDKFKVSYFDNATIDVIEYRFGGPSLQVAIIHDSMWAIKLMAIALLRQHQDLAKMYYETEKGHGRTEIWNLLYEIAERKIKNAIS